MIHFHRWGEHPVYVMWDRCVKCGKDRVSPRYYVQQNYAMRYGGVVTQKMARHVKVQPVGTRIKPPPI